MNSKLLVLLCVMASFSASAVERTADDEKSMAYWRNTGMSREFVKETINDKSCRKNPKYFAACLYAIQDFGLNGQNPVVVLPNSEVNDSDFVIGATVEKMGPITIGKIRDQQTQVTAKPPKPLTAMGAWNELKRVMNKQDKDFANLIKSRDLNIDRLFDEVLKIASTDPKEEQWLLGNALNKYIITYEDAHGHYAPLQEVIDESRHADSNLIGIGAELQDKDGQILIVRTFPGAPARYAGIKPGDNIVAVDGQPVAKLSLSRTVDMIKGPRGTTVRLSVVREGSKIPEISIVRNNIMNVNYEVIDLPQLSVGYIHLGSFNDEKACAKVSDAIGEERSRANVTVLDLRDDPGGLLEQAVCIASLFIGDKVVLKEVSLDMKQQMPLAAKSGTRPATDKPLIVLINAHSASASELITGAFQDYARLGQLNAWIVGERSWGKGTVQSVRPISQPRGLARAFTIARFHQPSGGSNQIRGIIPDFDIPFRAGMSEDDRFTIREEQVFPNAQPVGKASVQPPARIAQVKVLSRCMDREGSDVVSYLQNKGNEAAQDYQLWKALTLAQCQQGKQLRTSL